MQRVLQKYTLFLKCCLNFTILVRGEWIYKSFLCQYHRARLYAWAHLAILFNHYVCDCMLCAVAGIDGMRLPHDRPFLVSCRRLAYPASIWLSVSLKTDNCLCLYILPTFQKYLSSNWIKITQLLDWHQARNQNPRYSSCTEWNKNFILSIFLMIDRRGFYCHCYGSCYAW